MLNMEPFCLEYGPVNLKALWVSNFWPKSLRRRRRPSEKENERESKQSMRDDI